MDPLTQGQPQDQFQPIVPPAQSAPAAMPEPVLTPVSEPAPAPVSDDKQQVIDKIRNSKSVLVTVGANPSVDELASALGLTVMLSRLDKHVTTVFSGKIPPAIEFLDPEATFEDSVDSLRDFIIALSKDKADKLRYKVEDDVVKVFITPYKTVLTEKDLEFSQGDLNVDVVVALGVASEEDLDKALLAHGKVLHSATIVTINAGEQTSNLGVANWQDSEVSSIAELLIALGEALGPNLLDEQSSTALLTGIVAETNRFSNEKTTPKVMTISAQLMAAGANQQLVATNLRQEGMITEPIRTKKSKTDDDSSDDGGEVVLEHGSKKSKTKAADKSKKEPVALDDQDQKPEDDTSGEDDSLAELKSAVAESTAEVSVAEQAPELSQPDAADSDLPELKPDVADATANMPKIDPLPTLDPVTPAPAADEASLPSLADNSTITDDPAAADSSTDEADVDAARQAVEAAGEPEAPKEPSPADVPEPPELPAIDGGVATPADAAQPLAFTPPPFSPTGSDSDQMATEVPAPMDAFMGTHADAAGQNDLNALTTPSSPAPAMPGGMPPMPPMPPAGDQAGLPPMPPLPGQPTDPATGFQPQINPGFMQDMPQSQNTWTQAADDLATQNADKAAARQEKMDKKAQDYDQMVDRNRELQGLPPLNDVNGSGLPPLPPTQGE